MRGYLRKGRGRQQKRRFMELDDSGILRYYTDDSKKVQKGEVQVYGSVSWDGGAEFTLHCIPLVKGVAQTTTKTFLLTAAHSSTAEEWVIALERFSSSTSQPASVSDSEATNLVQKVVLLMQYVASSVDTSDESAVQEVFNAPVSDVLTRRFVAVYSRCPLHRAVEILSSLADITQATECVRLLLPQLSQTLLPPERFVDIVTVTVADAPEKQVEATLQQLLGLHGVDTTLIQTVCVYLNHFSISEAQLQLFVKQFLPAFLPQSQSSLDADFVKATKLAPKAFAWLIRHALTAFAASSGDLQIDVNMSRKDMLLKLGELAHTSEKGSDVCTGRRKLQSTAHDPSRRLMLRQTGRSLRDVPTMALLDAAARKCTNLDALKLILEAIQALQQSQKGHLTRASLDLNAINLSFQFLTWQDMCRTSMVCKSWRAWHQSNDPEASRLWEQVAVTLVDRDFGSVVVDSLYEPHLQESCNGDGNPWFEIAQHVGQCEYWQVPENVDGDACKYLVVHVSSESVVFGAAALQDSRPLSISRTAPSGDSMKSYAAAVVADVQRALTRLLGSWTWLRHAANTRMVVLEDKDPQWMRSRDAIRSQLLSSLAPWTAIEFRDALVGSFLVSGSANAVIVDGGRDWTRVLPVCSYQPQLFAATTQPNGGGVVSTFLARQLQEKGYNVTALQAELIKRETCFVLPAADVNCSCTDENTTFELPGGDMLTLGHERHLAAEVLFSPQSDGHDCMGVAEQVASSIQRCGIDTRKSLLTNIFVIGGAFDVPGFEERLRHEVAVACKQPKELVSVTYHGHRTSTYPYLGASIELESEEQ